MMIVRYNESSQKCESEMKRTELEAKKLTAFIVPTKGDKTIFRIIREQKFALF